MGSMNPLSLDDEMQEHLDGHSGSSDSSSESDNEPQGGPLLCVVPMHL